ncbi:MAG: aquaporin [Dehalococcoidia bacterium]|nr:aquaporin [Dehalococcoidia bacterium]
MALPPIIWRYAAELLGTFGMVLIGTGSIMVDALTGGRVTQAGIGLSFGIAVTAMIYATRHVSGAFINPAVTLGLAMAGRFPWRDVPLYVVFQLAGAAAASLLLLAALGSQAQMGATMPSGSVWESLGLEVLLTFLLMGVILYVSSSRWDLQWAAPVLIGATVGLEATFGGPISGASMNPARSFGPALVGVAWSHHWIYWVGPLVGAAGAVALFALVCRATRDLSRSSDLATD